MMIADGHKRSFNLNVRASYFSIYSRYNLTQIPFWEIEQADLEVM